jgi:hypothetical protein
MDPPPEVLLRLPDYTAGFLFFLEGAPRTLRWAGEKSSHGEILKKGYLVLTQYEASVEALYSM